MGPLPGTGHSYRASTSPHIREVHPASPTEAASRRMRLRSTLLDKSTPIPKPWLDEKRDPYVRVAYWTTYGIMLLGVFASFAVCWLGWPSVPLLDGSKLCEDG